MQLICLPRLPYALQAARWLLVKNATIVTGACIVTTCALFVFVKFGVPVAAEVVKKNLPFFLEALEALKHNFSNIIMALFRALFKVPHSSWKFLSTTVNEAIKSDSEAIVEGFISILQGVMTHADPS